MVDWKQIEKEIICPVCERIFDNPKVTPCLHTFCKECLETRIEATKILGMATCCPSCRTVLPAGSVYPSDFRVNRLIEIFKEAEKASVARSFVFHGCGKCEEYLPAVSWCVECQSLLCRECNEIHRKWKEFKAHTTVTPEEYARINHQEDFMVMQQSSNEEPVTDKEQNESDTVIQKNKNFKEMPEKIESSRNKKALSTEGTTNTGSSSREYTGNATNESLQKENQYPLYVAKFGYFTVENDILSFKKGDFFYIISNKEDWWYAKARHPCEKGYVPSNYLKKYISLEAYRWYVGAVTQSCVEDILKQPFHSSGSFLVRDYDGTEVSSDYILSVKDTHNKVRHYQILNLKDGEFCISLRRTFVSIAALISHYTQQADGLCGTLKDTSDWLSQRQRIIRRWEISRTDIICFTNSVGPCEYYEWWKGKWHNTAVTIRIPKEGFMFIAKFYEEVELMKQLKHDNIIEFYGICTQNKLMCITEFTNSGNLQAYLKTKGYTLLKGDLLNMGLQIASAMHYLEGKRCVHRNLHTVNIMVQSSKSLICKVANFTYAKILSKRDYVESTVQEKVPIKWTAPESWRSKRFTLKSDVWSFGIVLYELITYGTYRGLHEKELLAKLDSGYLLPHPVGCSKELYAIMKGCWKLDADSRPNFGTLQQELRKFL